MSLSGGSKLGNALRQISAKLQKQQTLRVGFLEGGTYPDGTSTPMVAAIQNYGAPKAGIEARPFFSTMVTLKSPTWSGDLAKILPHVKYDANAALNLMGQRISDQLQESINEWKDPPLAPATVAKKGFDKPLIDTKNMIDSVAFDIKV